MGAAGMSKGLFSGTRVPAPHANLHFDEAKRHAAGRERVNFFVGHRGIKNGAFRS
jgi:hypothetical protein